MRECVTQMEPRLHFLERPGIDATMVFLHGVTRCGEDWKNVVPLLDSNAHILLMDFRGHGGSERADSYFVMDYVQDIKEFLEVELRKKVFIIGHSLGAMVAAGVAALCPDYVDGLVLEDPPFHSMGERIQGTIWQIQFQGMQQVAREGGTIEEIALRLGEMRLPMPDGSSRPFRELRPPEAIRWSAECLSKLDANVLEPVVQGRWLEGFDVETIGSQIVCSTVLLQADTSVGGALWDHDANQFSRRIGKLSHEFLPGMGHQIHAVQPELIVGAIESVLG